MLGVRGGRLRVASFPSAGATLMPLAVATFRRGHPDVALTLAEGEPEEIGPRLRAGEFDLALLFEFPGVGERLGHRPADGRRCSRTRCTSRFPPTIRSPPSARLRLADLRGEDWVQTSESSPCARHVVRLCLTAGFEPKVTFESDDYETVQGLVAAGVGVALVPRLALTHVHPRDRGARALAAQPVAQGGRRDDGRARRRAGGTDDAPNPRRRSARDATRSSRPPMSQAWPRPPRWSTRLVEPERRSPSARLPRSMTEHAVLSRRAGRRRAGVCRRELGDRALEVGAGTGKATGLFAARGLRILGLEPSRGMAAAARVRLAGYENVAIEETGFEEWRPERDFRLLFSAQAWHWVTPEVRYTRAREALAEDGALAVFWNRPRWESSPLKDELAAAYRRTAPSWAQGGQARGRCNPTFRFRRRGGGTGLVSCAARWGSSRRGRARTPGR